MRLWNASPAFRALVAGGGLGAGAFVLYNVETVPVSGRRRFNWVGERVERRMGEARFEETLRQFRGKILPPHAPETVMARRVMERLVPNSGIEGEWEVFVVRDKMANAFVLPG